MYIHTSAFVSFETYPIFNRFHMDHDLWKQQRVCGNLVQTLWKPSKYESNNHIMSQLRRHSLDSNPNTLKNNQKESASELLSERKATDKPIASAKVLKTSGTMCQTCIKDQLKPKPNSAINNKCIHEDNCSTQQSPPKKRVNSELQRETMPGENNSESQEVKAKELKPKHEELKLQIFAGIWQMLEPIKEDIEQIKLDQ